MSSKMNDDLNQKEMPEWEKTLIAKQDRYRGGVENFVGFAKIFVLILVIIFVCGLILGPFLLFGVGPVLYSTYDWLKTGVWYMPSIYDVGPILHSTYVWLSTGVWNTPNIFNVLDATSNEPFEDWIGLRKILKATPIWVIALIHLFVLWLYNKNSK